MIVYRISQYLTLDGKGAATQLNNRWNSLGTRMLYTSESIALAKGEISRRTPLNLLPSSFMIIHIEIPDNQIEMANPLPPDWDEVPPGASTKETGDMFIKQNNLLCLKVPSVFDKQLFNYLINPLHVDFSKVKVIKTEPLYV